MQKILLNIYVIIFLLLMPPGNVFAASDPLSSNSNKFGINILSPEADIEEASKLVNNNGDWGWALVVIKKSEMNVDRWQSFLNLANKKHVIPIFRLATQYDGKGFWQKPSDEDAASWADFLSKLHFPTQNRYIQIYNEVNHANEWGGIVDAADYARELSKTIDVLKQKSQDFFVLNAPLDLALTTSGDSVDAATYYQAMESAVPGIFKKLDGWASHSYPNPDFSASPLKSGRTGIDGYKWEIAQISKYLSGKKLPVFITETGWRRTKDLDQQTISQYYQTAFEKVWNDNQITAVLPFLFNYPQPLFNEFSFKSADGTFYEYYLALKNMSKTSGKPSRVDSAEITTENEPYEITYKAPDNKLTFTIKNTGNYVWNTRDGFSLDLESGGINFKNPRFNAQEIYPGQEAIAAVDASAKSEGSTNFSIEVKNKSEVLVKKEVSVESQSYLSLIFKTLFLVFNTFNKSSQG